MSAFFLIALAFFATIECPVAMATSVAFGTGFAIAGGSLVITNFHVVRDCTAVNIEGIGSGSVPRLFNAAGWSEVSPRCNTGWAK